jgi:hypothetical protein
MADGRWQVLQGDLYMQIDRSIVLEKYIGKSLRIQAAYLRRIMAYHAAIGRLCCWCRCLHTPVGMCLNTLLVSQHPVGMCLNTLLVCVCDREPGDGVPAVQQKTWHPQHFRGVAGGVWQYPYSIPRGVPSSDSIRLASPQNRA